MSEVAKDIVNALAFTQLVELYYKSSESGLRKEVNDNLDYVASKHGLHVGESFTDLVEEYDAKNRCVLNNSPDICLVKAAKLGLLDLVSEFIKEGATDLNPAAVEAAKNGHIDVVELLMDSGAEADDDIYIASAFSGSEVLMRYLDPGEIEDKDRRTTLYTAYLLGAVRSGSLSLVNKALEQGALHGENEKHLLSLNLNPDSDAFEKIVSLIGAVDYDAALVGCSSYASLEGFKRVERLASIGKGTYEAAYVEAVRGNNHELEEYLRDKIAVDEHTTERILMAAAYSGNADLYWEYEGMTTDRGRHAAIYTAAMKGRYALLKDLSLDKDDYMLQSYAAYSGNRDIMGLIRGEPQNIAIGAARAGNLSLLKDISSQIEYGDEGRATAILTEAILSGSTATVAYVRDILREEYNDYGYEDVVAQALDAASGVGSLAIANKYSTTSRMQNLLSE